MTGERRVVTVVGALLATFASGACGGDHDARPDASPHGMAGRPDSHDAGVGGAVGGSGGTTGGAGQGGRGSPPALPPPSAHLPPGSVCELDGWCWYNPLPSGTGWNAVAGAGRTDLWIAGRSVLHFDGGRWTSVASPMWSVTGVWAASENDVWFVGYIDDDPTPEDYHAAAIAHWDGVSITVTAAFAEATEAAFYDIWGSGPSDVYAAGNATWHWDGSAWTVLPGVPGGQHITGTGPNDVWLASIGQGLLHFDGTTWSPIAEMASANITDLLAIAPDDVWAIDRGFYRTLVQHFDGVAWRTSLEHTDANLALGALGASAADDVWLTGLGSAPDGTYGYVNHYDGQTWQRAPVAPSPVGNVTHVPGVGTIAVGGEGTILQLTATPAPAFTELRTGSVQALAGVFGNAPDDMWAVGDAGTVLRFDGRSVNEVAVPTSANLLDVWGSRPDDVWIVGTVGTVLHWNGQSFTPIASGTTVDLRAVFTARPDDVWIGGDGGTLLHWNGSAMSAVAVAGVEPTTAILDIHGLGASDVWLTGGSRVIGGPNPTAVSFVSHFDGTSWSPVEVLDFSTYGQFLGERIWAFAPDDVWILNEFLNRFGYWHFDGATWTDGLIGEDDPPLFMFPNNNGPSFIFGPHDRWMVDVNGTWLRNTR